MLGKEIKEDIFAINLLEGQMSMSEFNALFRKAHLTTIAPPDNENPEAYRQFLEACDANKEISQAIAALENSVTSGVKTWTHNLEPDIREAMDFYYKLLKKQDTSKKVLSNLTEEESALLKMAEDFDVENLNVFKDVSKEEGELLSLAGIELDNPKQSANSTLLLAELEASTRMVARRGTTTASSPASDVSSSTSTVTTRLSTTAEQQGPSMLAQFQSIVNPASKPEKANTEKVVKRKIEGKH